MEIKRSLSVFESAKPVFASAGIETFENGTDKFAKFFLISDKENLKKWQVIPESIAKRLRTFIGMPFVSEPGLAHFGSDDKTLDVILDEQEDYRAGTIIDVQFNESTMTGFAIVKFANNALGNQTWEDINKGKAIYVSPAIAGQGITTPEGVKLFIDWVGIHLARVKSPAYGVFHASIKSSCEGNERTCVRNLLASASNFISSNDSFNIAGITPSKNMSYDNKDIDGLVTRIDTITTKIGELESKVTKIGTAAEPITNNKDTDPAPEPTKEGKAVVTDTITDPRNSPVSAAEERMKDLEHKVAMFEKKEHESAVASLVQMKQSAGLYASAMDMEEDKKRLASAMHDDIEKESAAIAPLITKLASVEALAGIVKSGNGRAVHQVASAATGNKPKITNLNDLMKAGVQI